MTTFLALYRGKTVGEAQMVAVSADTALVALVAERLLEVTKPDETTQADPPTRALEQGRRRALRLIASEVH